MITKNKEVVKGEKNLLLTENKIDLQKEKDLLLTEAVNDSINKYYGRLIHAARELLHAFSDRFE